MEADRKQEEGERRKHEDEHWKMQMEREDNKIEKNKRSKLADRITPWTDLEHPTEYLKRFEDIMQEAGIGKEQWPSRLIPLLTGKALAAYTYNVPRDAIASYPCFKEELLKSLGMSIERCKHEFWRMQRRYSDSWQLTARRIETMVDRMADSCTTVQEVKYMVSFNKLLSLSPADDAEYVRLKKPTSLIEVANLLDDRQAARKERLHNHIPGYGWGQQNNKMQPLELKHQDNPPTTKYTHLPSRPESWVPTCYGCGMKGHKKPDCPTKVSLIVTNSTQPDMYVQGMVGSEACLMKIDTGASMTVVNSSLVQPEQYTNKNVKLTGFSGESRHVPLVKVWLTFGEYCMKCTVAAVENCSEQVLLGMDLGLLEYLLKLEKEQKDECKLLLTRAECQKEVELNETDREADLVSGAEPIPMDQIFDFHDEIFSDEPFHSDQVQTVPDGADELLPIPNLVQDQAHTELLKMEQGEDETLATIRAQGNKNEKGIKMRRDTFGVKGY